MATILHIETATPVCSVAVSRSGSLIVLKETHEDKSHATQLTLFIEEVLKKAKLSIEELDAFSLSMGPGSYTGLRIGASVIKGLAYGSNKPVIGIGTLDALAIGFQDHMKNEKMMADEPFLLCPMLDARRDEVYAALFSSSMEVLREVSADVLSPSIYDDYLDQKRIYFFGSGSFKASQIIKHPNAHFILGIEPSAQWQIPLAMATFDRQEFLDTAYFEPFYLKEFIATTPKNKVIKPPN